VFAASREAGLTHVGSWLLAGKGIRGSLAQFPSDEVGHAIEAFLLIPGK